MPFEMTPRVDWRGREFGFSVGGSLLGYPIREAKRTSLGIATFPLLGFHSYASVISPLVIHTLSLNLEKSLMGRGEPSRLQRQPRRWNRKNLKVKDIFWDEFELKQWISFPGKL